MDGIRPLTNLLFKRYTVILIDTPPLPQNKQDPPLSPNKIQSNKRKQNIQGIYLKLTCELPTCYYLLVYMYVWEGRGGGGNKAYSLHITKNDIYTYIYFKIMIS